MMENKKPMGWEYVKLGEISAIQSGGTPARGKSNYWGGDIPWVKISDLKEFYVSKTDEFITEEGLSNSSSRIFPSGTILFTIFASIGKIGVLKIDAATNQAVAGITPSEHLDWKFLTYSLLDLSLSIQQHGKGVAQKNINLTILKSTLIPIPPLPEQKRIVAKLDALFGHLDLLREKLDRIPELLKNFRQQVLTQAVTGKLTEDGMKNWQNLSVSEIGEVTGGLTKNGKRKALNLKLPYLRVANVYANELRLEEILEIGLTEKELERTGLQPNDLLIVEGNGSPDQIGRVALWNGSITPCVHQNHLIKVRVQDLSTAKYLLYYLLSPVGRARIAEVSVSTSGLYTLSISKVKKLPVNLPDFKEQKEIVKKVESLFSAADKIEAQYQNLKEKIEQLPQAILAKAFKGELVEQDDNDEPAGVLLERIKDNRSGKGSKKAYEQEVRLGMVAEDK